MPGAEAADAAAVPSDGPTAIHATCLVVGERALLIRGPAGSGKSTLARALVAAARTRGRYADLVADDRVVLVRHGAALVARPHPLIAGRQEVRGLGIRSVAHEPAARVAAIVDLVAERPERMPPDQDGIADLLGLFMPRLVQRRHEADLEAILLWFVGLLDDRRSL